MQRLSMLFPFILVSLLVAGCSRGTPYGQIQLEPEPVPVPTAELRLNFEPLIAGQPFEPTATYASPTGRNHRFTAFKFMLSDLRVVGQAGEDILLSDLFVDLIEQKIYTPDTIIDGLTLTLTVPAGRYRGLRAGLGVPTPRNNDNPAQYVSSHPLSFNRGMFWAWTTGYIFMKIEGRYDTTAQNLGDLGAGYFYHTGRNSLFRELAFNQDFTAEADQVLDLSLRANLDRALFSDSDQIDITVDNFTHSTPPDGLVLSQRVTDNVVGGVFSLHFD
jgi:hypothetical protein